MQSQSISFWQILLTMALMPFVVGFHVSMGAPWMLTSVLVEFIFLTALAFPLPTFKNTTEQKNKDLVQTNPVE